MSTYIKKLIQQGEHQRLDFKFAITDSPKIARSLVAFANTDGGTLLIGVKDNGAIAGVRSEEEFYMVEAAAQIYSRPEIRFKTTEWKVDKKTILEITIPKSKEKPHSAPDKDKNWKVYIRVNDQNLLANSILLKVWKNKKRNTPIQIKYKDKEKQLLNYLKENKTITLSKFCKTAFITQKTAEKILIDFATLNLIEITFTEKEIYYQLKEELCNDQ